MYQANLVGFAILYCPVELVSADPVFAKVVRRDNVVDHIASLLPLVQVNQNIGSFFMFNSREYAVRLISENVDFDHHRREQLGRFLEHART